MQGMIRPLYYVTEKAFAEDESLERIVATVRPWLEGHRRASCFLVVKSLSEVRFLCEFESQAFVRIEKEGMTSK